MTLAPVGIPFTGLSTAAEIVAELDLTGKRAVVTGASSGIGAETARALASAGAEVTLAVRDVAAGGAVADAIYAETGNELVHVGRLDLTDMRSIESFAQDWDGPLHMLVANAAVMGLPELRTPEGWELHLATNHLGHFALARRLRLALAVADGARVVSVSAAAHRRHPIDLDDPHFLQRPYQAAAAYGQSKTANVLFAVEAARRWADDGIVVNAAAPGTARTGLARHLTELARIRLSGARSFTRWKTVAQAAATPVMLAASPYVAGITGQYVEDVAVAPVADGTGHGGVAAHAMDPQAAARLWDVSVRAVG